MRVPERQIADVIADVRAALEQGEPSQVIGLLEEARQTFRDPDLDELLLERYLALPLEDAEACLRTWWEREHDRFSSAGLAQILTDKECRSEALEILAQSQGTSASPEYWRLLAMLRDEGGETEAAVTAMELYTRLIPDNADGWIVLSDMQQRLSQHDRALQSLRKAGDALPNRILPRMLRLRILADDNRWREARDLAESLLEGHYEDASVDVLHDLRDLLARAYCTLGDWDGARHLWQSLHLENPANAEVARRLAALEALTRRHRRALVILDELDDPDVDQTILDLRLRCLLALHEYDEASALAQQIDEQDAGARAGRLVRATQAIDNGDYAWGIELLEGTVPPRYAGEWNNHRLDCLARLARWQDILPALKAIEQPDDRVLIRAAVHALAANKLELAERLAGEVDDHQSGEARMLTSLLGPLRQAQRAAEARRQQQVDDAEKQRRAADSRELRRRIRELEGHNAALAGALARSEAAHERLLELVGVATDGGIPTDWEDQLLHITERAHKDALEQDLQRAEQRLRAMVGERCWSSLSESARSSLRQGEWLFTALEGDDRDYGASLLEYARGLERAFKDAIFVPAKSRWERDPSLRERLQDEGHDPSLAPFVRYLLQSSHLTLGSMASTLDRMGDARRQGVAVSLLRRHLAIDPDDQRTLQDWRNTADKLALAADARNQPAHAGAVSRDAVVAFRELVLGSDGLLRSLDR